MCLMQSNSVRGDVVVNITCSGVEFSFLISSLCIQFCLSAKYAACSLQNPMFQSAIVEE